ncbi:MAG: LysM peptidoglycan-binding domain-containing protein [Candidatus Omnitrophica bacterium]|nr:LysM peptidoglycan-binding domain-containing protein [Candidatus Omnitrophota bacterium]
MKRYLILLGIVLLSGCLVRTYEVTKPRTDLQVAGNQGYLSGTPPQPAPLKFGDKRKVSVMEVELGSHRYLREKKIKQEDKNVPAQASLTSEDQEQTTEPSQEQENVNTGNYQEYTVAKEDTLQKISQKFYGTTKKWQMLYEANKDVLKSPDKVYPGTKIKIPAQ